MHRKWELIKHVIDFSIFKLFRNIHDEDNTKNTKRLIKWVERVLERQQCETIRPCSEPVGPCRTTTNTFKLGTDELGLREQ